VKQVAQRPRDGKVVVVDAPAPRLRPGFALVANRCSVISAGTERSKIELGSKNLLQKARARPDQVGKVVDRARREGVRSALRVAQDRLDSLVPLGYSSAGVVLGIGADVQGIGPGDRVVCAGGGYANHAETVAVPKNLLARIPEEVTFERAAYATIGAIALHAVRRAEAGIGERVGVIGLGLVGQLAVRILTVSGCRTFGIDLDEQAVLLAEGAGARAFLRSEEGLERSVVEASDGLGLDSVLVCASSRSADPIELAAALCRDRGRIVVVGDVPVQSSRSLLYEKELELRLSRSYGPGRYDTDYEERGRDFPAGYVRWTEQRNLVAFLELVAEGKLDPSELTTHRFQVDKAESAYAALSDPGETVRPFGVVLEYAGGSSVLSSIGRSRQPPRRAAQMVAPRIGMIGAGAFARGTLLPALRDQKVRLVAVASGSGLTASDVARRFRFERTATSSDEIFADADIDAVVIATRHSSHATLVMNALRAGKAVFVEKPLALTEEELAGIEAELAAGGLLMVGFNRRFAPFVRELTDELEHVAAPSILVRVNAGPLPGDHWLHDLEEGGGRILGEACHFVDLIAHLGGASPASVHAIAVPQQGRSLEASDEVVATLRLANGAVGTLLYSGGGDARLPKERIEAFGGGVSAVIDDFRRLELYRGGRRKVVKRRQDKGHAAEIEHFVRAVRGDADIPAAESYLSSMRATLALVESLRYGAERELA
jgi:predicted dehydrogenase/threonine dehydrogenase-like Zn-dependent dehydrogenase